MRKNRNVPNCLESGREKEYMKDIGTKIFLSLMIAGVLIFAALAVRVGFWGMLMIGMYLLSTIVLFFVLFFCWVMFEKTSRIVMMLICVGIYLWLHTSNAPVIQGKVVDRNTGKGIGNAIVRVEYVSSVLSVGGDVPRMVSKKYYVSDEEGFFRAEGFFGYVVLDRFWNPRIEIEILHPLYEKKNIILMSKLFWKGWTWKKDISRYDWIKLETIKDSVLYDFSMLSLEEKYKGKDDPVGFDNDFCYKYFDYLIFFKTEINEEIFITLNQIVNNFHEGYLTNRIKKNFRDYKEIIKKRK